MDELLRQIDLEYYRSARLLIVRTELEQLRQERSASAEGESSLGASQHQMAISRLRIIAEWLGFVGFSCFMLAGMILACVFYPLILCAQWAAKAIFNSAKPPRQITFRAPPSHRRR